MDLWYFLALPTGGVLSTLLLLLSCGPRRQRLLALESSFCRGASTSNRFAAFLFVFARTLRSVICFKRQGLPSHHPTAWIRCRIVDRVPSKNRHGGLPLGPFPSAMWNPLLSASIILLKNHSKSLSPAKGRALGPRRRRDQFAQRTAGFPMLNQHESTDRAASLLLNSTSGSSGPNVSLSAAPRPLASESPKSTAARRPHAERPTSRDLHRPKTSARRIDFIVSPFKTWAR